MATFSQIPGKTRRFRIRNKRFRILADMDARQCVCDVYDGHCYPNVLTWHFSSVTLFSMLSVNL